MPNSLNSKNKVDVLLKLIEENRKQAEWVKNLDYKIVYYTVILLGLVIVWITNNPKIELLKEFFFLTIIMFGILSIIFLLRNHIRHSGLNKEYGKIIRALLLTQSNVYHQEPIYNSKKRGIDWMFHLGRSLYILFIVISVIIAYICANKIFLNRVQ